MRNSVETEVKLRFEGTADEAHARVESVGAKRMTRAKECDQLYDTPVGELRASGRVLRLRERGDQAILTYKGPPQASIHKTREERETSVASTDEMRRILSGLGYVPTLYYEKYRTEYSLGEGVITVDETPIGNFIELEGPGPWIDKTAELLGYTPADYITASYIKLYLEHVAQHGGDPTAMRFVGE